MDFKIIFDSCLDFNDTVFTEDIDLSRVPFRITIEDEEMIDRNLSTYMLTDKMKMSRKKLTTACASPQEYIEAMEPDKNNIIVTISSRLSGSYNAAMVAKTMAEEKYPGIKIDVIDSKSAASGEDLLFMKIKDMVLSGEAFGDIVDAMRRFVSNMKTFFILNSLDNLAKNGRISNAIALIGKMLHVIPILGADDGTIELVDKARGKKKTFDRFIKIIIEEAGDARNKTIAITHVHAQEKAQQLKNALESLSNFKDIVIFEAGGLSTAYADDGGLIVSF